MVKNISLALFLIASLFVLFTDTGFSLALSAASECLDFLICQVAIH